MSIRSPTRPTSTYWPPIDSRLNASWIISSAPVQSMIASRSGWPVASLSSAATSAADLPLVLMMWSAPYCLGVRSLPGFPRARASFRPAPESPGVRARLWAEPAYAENRHRPIGTHGTRLEKLLDASVGSHTGIGERCEFLELELR